MTSSNENSSNAGKSNLNSPTFEPINAIMKGSFFDLYVESGSDILVSMDTSFRIQYVNSVCFKVLGYTMEEMVKLPISQFNPSRDGSSWERILKKSMELFYGSGRKNFSYKTAAVNKRGNVLFFDVKIRIVAGTNCEVCALNLILHDITEKKKQEQKRREFIRKLKEHNTVKDKYFSVIAAELTNPLVRLLGFSDMLITEYDYLNDEKKIVYIKELKKATNQAYEMLHNLNAWSRSSTNKSENRPKDIRLKDIFENSIEMLAVEVAEKNVHVFNHIEPKIFVHADEFMLKTIIRNLLNITLYGKKKNGSMVVNAWGVGSNVEISINSSLDGVYPRHLKKNFDMENNLQLFSNERNPSAGLKLILCKEFLLRNNGDLWITSEPGKEEIFTITLPRF